MASVKEEIEIVNTYLDIEKVRFGDRIKFVIQVNPDVSEHQMPRFLIQPLVENALKHGLNNKADDGLLQVLVDKDGKQLLGKDHDRRFFEGSFMHKFNGKYYFTYSTGDTHYLCYAIGDKPMGKFVYQGVFLKPVQGWTTHHSIIEFKGKWYLFYHDTELSGKNHLRNVKVTELDHKADGSIGLIDPFVK